MEKTSYHYASAIVLGSGAAGLAAAMRLKETGIDDTVILTEGLNFGTSINAGSDKQTYYKLGIVGSAGDSPEKMAADYLAGGSADGRLALIESTVSVQAFFRLVELGVGFPKNDYGEYVCYKTDHDPCGRATSAGPYTSRDMCRALIGAVRRLEIPIHENRVCVRLAACDIPNAGSDNPVSRQRTKKIAGLIAVNTKTGEWEVWRTRALVFAVGGPGGLYAASVYPQSQTGGIGLALEIGAEAVSLPESQFGLASVTPYAGKESGRTEFRWNVSGTYMQVLPRMISTGPDGFPNGGKNGTGTETKNREKEETADRDNGGVREFLLDYFPDNLPELYRRLFLKGYQWPFDVRKIDGSSLIDMIVFYETAVKKRRVYLDYRTNPAGLEFAVLPAEARDYLEKSDALFGTPFERLNQMNPKAVALYRDHGLDLAREPLEIRLCAQHNNGGLAVDIHWESTNISGLFPIGEVAGTHGVTRPGGSALNAGQVGAIRAAERIVSRLRQSSAIDSASENAESVLKKAAASLQSAVGAVIPVSNSDWQKERAVFQTRMTRYAGHLRFAPELEQALLEARLQQTRLQNTPLPADGTAKAESLRNRTLLLAQIVYFEAILQQLRAQTGSRGSAAALDPAGTPVHPLFPAEWRILPESAGFRRQQLHTQYCPQSQTVCSRWLPVPSIPAPNRWFESVWASQK